MAKNSLEDLVVHAVQEIVKAIEEDESASIERLKALSDDITSAVNDAKAGPDQVSNPVQTISFDDLQKRFDEFKAKAYPQPPPSVAKNQGVWPANLAAQDKLDLEGGKIPDPPPTFGWDPAGVAGNTQDDGK